MTPKKIKWQVFGVYKCLREAHLRMLTVKDFLNKGDLRLIEKMAESTLKQVERLFENEGQSTD